MQNTATIMCSKITSTLSITVCISEAKANSIWFFNDGRTNDVRGLACNTDYICISMVYESWFGAIKSLLVSSLLPLLRRASHSCAECILRRMKNSRLEKKSSEKRAEFINNWAHWHDAYIFPENAWNEQQQRQAHQQQHVRRVFSLIA